MNAIIPRATIEDIVRYRNSALDLYSTAYDRIADAQEAIAEAEGMAGRAYPGTNNYNYSHDKEREAFLHAGKVEIDRDRYLRTARKLIDCNAWAWIIERTDLERLMDREAKDKLRAQMAYVPDRVSRDGELITDEEAGRGLPELTVENIQATLQAFLADADTIFRRGIANAFSRLDRRFRSHDGFKVGSRLILTRFFNDWGSINYGRTRDELIDIERVFAVLDGIPESSFITALNAVEHDRRGALGPRQSEVETEYFKIRGFKNGNAHLWFKRADLVERVNKLLAEYYGEVIGDAQQAEADPFADVKHAPAKYYGFYPTPEAAVSYLLDRARFSFLRRADQPQLRVLEPSAGTGNLARRAITSMEAFSDWSGFGREESMAKWRKEYRFDNLVDCVELQPHLAIQLEAEGIYNRVFTEDFLKLTPASTGHYDVVIMNPPFDRERDIDHVMHAVKFLKPGGTLIAIMSAGTEFRETRKATAFRKFVEDNHRDRWTNAFQDMPAGSFAEVGTYVNTIFVKITTKMEG